MKMNYFFSPPSKTFNNLARECRGYLSCVKPKRGQLIIPGPIFRDKQACTLASTPEGNLESLINPICTSLSSGRKNCWGGSRSSQRETRQEARCQNSTDGSWKTQSSTSLPLRRRNAAHRFSKMQPN